MSNKNLVKAIVNNSITNAGANCVTMYKNGLAKCKHADAARVKAITNWKFIHDYDATMKAAKKKGASDTAKHDADVMKVAFDVFAKGTRETYAAACKPARVEMNNAVKFFFGKGVKDESTKSNAFYQFYNAYTEFRATFAENFNTPAGKKVLSACVNMYDKCFGVKFSGDFGKRIARKTVNVIGMRNATMTEERKGAHGITVFTDIQVKNMVVRIMYNLMERGDFGDMERE